LCQAWVSDHGLDDCLLGFAICSWGSMIYGETVRDF